MRTNTIMLIMPFLIMGIGVNDAFLMIHSWHRTSKQGIPVDVRLGLVLEDVGPSITITTLTNVITFSIGSLTPTPEIQLFCIATATALGFAYIYSLVLFVPVMYLASVYENRNVHSLVAELPKKQEKSDFFSKTTRIYSKILQHKFFTYSLLIGVLVYWYFAILGTLTIKSKLDTEKILPRDTPIRTPHEVIMRLVWNEYYPVTVFVNNPLDIRRADKLDRLYSMLAEFEEMKLCRGKEFTNIWLRDYIKYCKEHEFDFDFYSDDGAAATTKAAPFSETGLDYKRLKEFLSSPFYKHYNSFLRLVNTSSELDAPVSKFMFVITFHNTSSNWDQRIQLMQDWRAIADKYSDLNVTVWETNGMFVDQMLSLKRLTLTTCLLTLGCMAVVCGVFIQNPLSVLTATAAILSISLGVIGYLSWWHLDLDPATMCAVLMSIGMSVDFTAHVAYHFQLAEQSEIREGKIFRAQLLSQNDKLEHTLKSVAWPMTQAGISTVISILPLICLQNYIPLVFVKTISLVVIWGLFHGLVLLPAFLVVMPKKWLEANCYRMIFDKATASAMNELDSNEPEETKSALIISHDKDLENEFSLGTLSRLDKSDDQTH
uniref:SSD domain-containing protein n=1 Tax=Acrobeloides nanus TaxID=290746 RepID=A0A914EAA3_9BILA